MQCLDLWVSAQRSYGGASASSPLPPAQYAIAAYCAMAAFTVIALSGAAVRLTGSGLGCPRWPRCYGNVYPPSSTHALIEFSNRMVTIPVTIAAFAAFALAFRRRPYRRDLMWLSALLPLGVLAQAVLGGLTVRGELDYGWVMGHFALSMLVLAAAVALAWRASHEPGERPRTTDRALLLARPCDGGVGGCDDLRRNRRHRRRSARGGLPRTAHQKALFRRQGDDGLRDPPPRRDRAYVRPRGGRDMVVGASSEGRPPGRCGGASLEHRHLRLIALQGLVGLDQYKTHLPTELVWVHVSLASLTWVSVLWTACAVGRLEPRFCPRGGA